MSTSIFEHVKQAVDSKSNLIEMRQEAFEQFERMGIPTRRTEAWKYTPVTNFVTADTQFETNTAEATDVLDSYGFPEGHRLVFVDGVFNEGLSSQSVDNDTFKITTLQEALSTNSEVFQKHFNEYLQTEQEPFSALNTALLKDGVFVYFGKNHSSDLPIYIFNIATGSKPNLLVQPRNLVIAESMAEASIVSVNLGVGVYNQATEIMIADNAEVNWYSIQPEVEELQKIDTIQAKLRRNARFNAWNIDMGGKLIRNNVNVDMDGEGAEANLNGFFWTRNDHHVDNHLYISHNEPHCLSNQLYKGLMDDSSTGVFNGKVYVKQDAQKTNAFQSNKNILLSDNATINTKPELEIYADDVKCSHGATTGQLDENMLFYLRARGLNELQAKAILNQAFIGEVISTINNEPLQEWLLQVVEQRFAS